MLTGDLVRPRLTRRGNRLTVDTLPLNDPSWTRTASDLIALWNRHAGQTREVWENAVENYLGDRVDYITVRGLAKVLTDAADFSPLETVLVPEDIRERLFAAGPAFTEADLFHPQTREDRLAALAADLGTTPKAIETALYADRPGENIVADPGPNWTPPELITRYNLELHRGVLYWSNLMEVEIYDTFKDFWRYLKLFKLMSPIMGFEYDEACVQYLIEKHYEGVNRPFRACQPRDLLLQVRNYCVYKKQPKTLSNEAFDFAVENYFSVM